MLIHIKDGWDRAGENIYSKLHSGLEENTSESLPWPGPGLYYRACINRHTLEREGVVICSRYACVVVFKPFVGWYSQAVSFRTVQQTGRGEGKKLLQFLSQ